MDEELKQLKSVLRSLVVSSATEVDVRTLMRDYRMMVGNQLPLAKFGHKEPVGFLKEYFSDCFLFQGPKGNPVLTLIVPDSLKHIDKFVQKQRVNNVKSKGKRRSVQKNILKQNESHLIVETFNARQTARNQETTVLKNEIKIKQEITKEVPTVHKQAEDKEKKINNTEIKEFAPCSQTALQNFLKKRTPLFDCQLSNIDKDSDKDGDSGRVSSSSTSSRRAQKEQLHKEIKDIVIQNPNGVTCTDLMRLYRARYNRELNYTRVGYTSVLSAACEVDGLHVSRRALTDDWLLSDAARPPPSPAPARPPPAHTQAHTPALPEDALPGIDFEPDVFPADCVHFLDSIPSVSLEHVRPGDMLQVAVAEVYSPSHFWLLRLGDHYNIAMEEIMDDMNKYYYGEGRDRALALGAVRVGQYCASLYRGDWHRSIIVRVLDHDTVKVRHVDYGTVERVAAGGLRVLLRRYAALEAQAVRARLGGVAPPAAGRRWPHASSTHFLRLVRDRPLVANVVATHGRERALEVLLIDTSTPDDRCLAAELVRSGHADPRPAPHPTSECYLYPRFEALEGGDTPSFAEVHAYLRDGIALDFVDDYRRHVPPPLPPADCPPSPRPLPPAPSPAGVCLSAAECESFCVLSRVDPAAAHRFMLEAMSRALVPAPPAPPPAPPRSPHSSSSSMNSEGRGFPSPTYYSLLRPPPGFETD